MPDQISVGARGSVMQKPAGGAYKGKWQTSAEPSSPHLFIHDEAFKLK